MASSGTEWSVWILLEGREPVSRNLTTSNNKSGKFYIEKIKGNGDSGGPLGHYDSVRERWVEFGIVSFGASSGCEVR